MSPLSVIITVLAYFAVMFTVSWISSRNADNAGFFNGGRKAPWWIVAIAMIGAPMSGVTYVSVPGMVGVGCFAGRCRKLETADVVYSVVAGETLKSIAIIS